MKTLALLACLATISSCATADDAKKTDMDTIDYVTSARICPKGFTYAGEDSPKDGGDGLMLKSYWSEEVARSPVYSCYKALTSEEVNGGFNQALAACSNLDTDAHLVALEDEQEIRRVYQYVKATKGVNMTTSAMKFADIDKWIWLGSNQTEVPHTYHIVSSNDAQKEQCLVLSSYTGDDMAAAEFRSVECNVRSEGALCEVRVQTVTYLAWFYSNWLSFLLVLMTILLMSALCISVFKYKSGRRVYRNRRAGTGGPNTRATAAVTTVHGNAAPPSHLPYNDAPPTYNDVTGTGNKMDKYKNKGKDILAKVTLYKNNPTAANNA